MAPALAQALGATVDIGDASADLTGSVTLGQLRIGGLLRADAVEVGTSWASILAGSLHADQIRVENPSLSVHADGRGYSNLERIARRALAARRRRGRSEAGSERRAPPRVLVTGGDLVIDLGARGQLRVAEVELAPRAGAVRAIAGSVEVALEHGGVQLRGHFDRAAADFDLRQLAGGGAGLARALADGGELELSPGAGARPVKLSRAIVAAGIGDATAELSAQVAEPGRPGALRLALVGGQLRAEAEAVPLRLAAALLPPWIDAAAATVSGTARLGADRFAVDASVEGAVLDHRRLAAEPVAADLGVRLRGTRTGRAVRLEAGTVTLGSLQLSAAGQLRLAGGLAPAAAELELSLAPVACNAVIASLPRPVREPLIGLAADGQLSGRVRLAFDRARPRATEIAVDLDVDGCRVEAEAAAADPRSYARGGQLELPDGRVRRFASGAPGYVPLAELPEHVPGAFVAAEDGPFFRHRGFDLHQIERSLAANLAAGQLRRGGSTITQQLAKNLFLRRDRTLVRKLQEALLTWRLEAVLGKQRILELYLNLIELSDQDHYGIVEAARHWFGVEPAALSVRQAAFLAALTSEPTSMSRRIRAAGGLDPDSAARVDAVLAAMRRDRLLSRAEHARARRERLALRAAVLTARR